MSLVFVVAGAARAQPTRAGNEFQVNVYTTSGQLFASAGMANDGRFVIAWQSFAQDGSAAYGIFARRFSAAGSPQDTEFQVNTYTPGGQRIPSIGVDADGDFVVAWQSAGEDGAGYGVFARRFSSAGSALGGEFQVNIYTTGSQYYPVVAADANGNFVVAWQSSGQDGSGYGVFARRFSSAGSGVGGEFQVNTSTIASQRTPAIDLATDGDFVVVWVSDDVSGFGISGQRFSSAGAHQGPEFGVNTFQTGNQVAPAVGVRGDGEFVVAWASASQDGSAYGIFSRRFDSTGAPQGTEIQVNVYTTGDQGVPAIATDADGDFVVTWQSALQDGSGLGVFARRFKASGAAQSGDLQANSYTSLDQTLPAVATDAGGHFIVSWSSTNQDGSGFGIFAQRFDVPIVIDIDGDGQYLALTDGLLLLRFGFGFTGATLISGAVGPGCTRCDGPSITAYLHDLL